MSAPAGSGGAAVRGRRAEGRLSLVVPVFDEEAVIEAFHERAAAAAGSIPGMELEIVYVDDGSRDRSLELLRRLAAADPRARVVKLSRNFGHQVAITAGLDAATGDCVVVLDADLQDPPEVVPEMVERWRQGYEVVYGRRVDRDGERPLKRWTARLFYRLLHRLVKIEIPVDVGDFRLLSRRAADELGRLRERDRFLRGLVSWVGFPQTAVDYHRERRLAGETKFPWRRMIAFAFDGISSFSTAPLRLATWLGWGASLLAFLYLASVFVQKALGHTVRGWATIMVALLFLGGVQLICLGIMGEYLGRIFREVKGRPLYVVEERIGGEGRVAGFAGGAGGGAAEEAGSGAEGTS